MSTLSSCLTTTALLSKRCAQSQAKITMNIIGIPRSTKERSKSVEIPGIKAIQPMQYEMQAKMVVAETWRENSQDKFLIWCCMIIISPTLIKNEILFIPEV